MTIVVVGGRGRRRPRLRRLRDLPGTSPSVPTDRHRHRDLVSRTRTWSLRAPRFFVRSRSSCCWRRCTRRGNRALPLLLLELAAIGFLLVMALRPAAARRCAQLPRVAAASRSGCSSSIRCCSWCRCPMRCGARCRGTRSTRRVLERFAAPDSRPARPRDLGGAGGDRVRLARAAAAARVPRRRARRSRRRRWCGCCWRWRCSPASRRCSGCCRSAAAAIRSSRPAATQALGDGDRDVRQPRPPRGDAGDDAAGDRGAAAVRHAPPAAWRPASDARRARTSCRSARCCSRRRC